MFLGFLLALRIEKCIAHWAYYVGGANVFQKEKEKETETETEMEEETRRSPNKWRTTRDFPGTRS